MKSRIQLIYRSFRSVPLWVQIWLVTILVPVNAIPFFFLDTPVGQAAAMATLFVLATNLPLMWYTRGMNRVLAIPHLLGWGPLVSWLLYLLLTGDSRVPADSDAWRIAMALVVVNGISLAFDALDSYRWLRGERDTPGIA